jgi:hypothetical protein
LGIHSRPKYSASHETYKRELISILQRFSELARDLDIEYWILSGTLLGLMRDGEILPWDDDVDVALTRESYNALEHHPSLQANLNRLDLIACFSNNPDRPPKVRIKGQHYPFLDLIVYDREGGFLVNPRFADEYFRADEVFPPKNCSLHGVATLCPSRPEPYLERAFGSYASWVLFGTHWTIPRTYATHGVPGEKEDFR